MRMWNVFSYHAVHGMLCAAGTHDLTNLVHISFTGLTQRACHIAVVISCKLKTV